MDIDLRTFPQRLGVTRVGEILYLPRAPFPHELVGATESLPERLHRLPEEVAVELRLCPTTLGAQCILERIATDAGWASPHGPPVWFSQLPSAYRRLSERAWAIANVQDPNILPYFPYTGIDGGYIVDLDRETLIGGAYPLFHLARLGGIRQLAWLSTPILPGEGPDIIPSRFEHYRLGHVLDVGAVANLLAQSADLSEQDARTLLLAAVTHDARTPAGGDTTKLLDPAAFDEDAHYGTLLIAPKVQAFLARFGIDQKMLVATVLGKGLLGELLDIADKTAYVSRDAFWFHQRYEGMLRDCEEGWAIHSLLRSQPEACGAWRSVMVRDGRAVFTDPEALARFLLLRALLFRALYYHPGARFTEFIVSHLILRHLYDTGAVTANDLLTWRDIDLDRRIEEFSQSEWTNRFGEPCFEGFDDKAAAEKRRRELLERGERCVIIESMKPRVKSGTDFLVRDARGRRRPLKDAYPDLAEPIDALARVVTPHRLYWIPLDTLPHRLRDIVCAVAT